MPVPKKRTSHSKRNMRRAHDFLTPSNPIQCSGCGEFKLPHRVCPSCGEYRGKKLVDNSASSSSKSE